MNNLIKQLNPILVDEQLVNAITIKPEYRTEAKEKGERLMALLDIYKIFLPNKTTINIYNRLYLSVVSSLEKKDNIEETKILNNNFKVIKGAKRYGVIGGLESMRITGTAGLGKTSSVLRCVDLITRGTIKRESPIREIIPILFVECVADGSFKSLLFSILEEVDSILDTSFLKANKRVTTTVDMLLSAVSSVLTNHVALLIIDEVERMANDSRKGETLINYLTQLVNQSNISICFVGNESANSYFKEREYLARRTIGLSIHKMNYDEEFYSFLSSLFEYQYTSKKVSLNGELANVFYKYSNGIPGILISLFVESQRNAILSGEEVLSAKVVEDTFKINFTNLYPFIEKEEVHYFSKHKEQKNEPIKNDILKDNVFLRAYKISDKDVNKAINFLKNIISVEYVR